MDDEVRVLGTRESERQLAPAASIRLERPPKEVVAREELIAIRLAIAGAWPDLFAGSTATDTTDEETREDDVERRVEPDHGVGTWPHEVARSATRVVAVDHPRIAFDRASNALAEDFDRDHCPVRTPVERVELDVRDAEPTR
jgi:hypothetical protein